MAVKAARVVWVWAGWSASRASAVGSNSGHGHGHPAESPFRFHTFGPPPRASRSLSYTTAASHQRPHLPCPLSLLPPGACIAPPHRPPLPCCRRVKSLSWPCNCRPFCTAHSLTCSRPCGPPVFVTPHPLSDRASPAPPPPPPPTTPASPAPSLDIPPASSLHRFMTT